MDDAIIVELTGPRMETETADPRVVLEFAAAYFRALERVASSRLGESLDLHGLRIVDKCIGVASAGSGAVLPRAVNALDVALQDPFERDAAIRALGQSHRSLGAGVAAAVIIGGTTPREIKSARPFDGVYLELVDFQASVLRVGGKPPTVDLIDRSAGDSSRVSLSGDLADIKAISKHLFGLVNVLAEVETAPLTERRTGRLISFDPVPNVDPIAAWREWFANNAPEWNDVDDVDAELGR